MSINDGSWNNNQLAFMSKNNLGKDGYRIGTENGSFSLNGNINDLNTNLKIAKQSPQLTPETSDQYRGLPQKQFVAKTTPAKVCNCLSGNCNCQVPSSFSKWNDSIDEIDIDG